MIVPAWLRLWRRPPTLATVKPVLTMSVEAGRIVYQLDVGAEHRGEVWITGNCQAARGNDQ